MLLGPIYNLRAVLVYCFAGYTTARQKQVSASLKFR